MVKSKNGFKYWPTLKNFDRLIVWLASPSRSRLGLDRPLPVTERAVTVDDAYTNNPGAEPAQGFAYVRSEQQVLGMSRQEFTRAYSRLSPAKQRKLESIVTALEKTHPTDSQVP